jgi:hypothetical protein
MKLLSKNLKPLKNEKKRPTEVSTQKISAGNRRVSFNVSLKKEAKPDFFRGYKFLLFALAFFAPVSAFASEDSLFDIVPKGDVTYSQLKQLEKAGLIKTGAGDDLLTRFEVAKLIRDAESKYEEIVVAQATLDIPPPPPSYGADDEPIPAEAAATPEPEKAPARPTALPTPDESPIGLDRAAINLHSLEEAYYYELKVARYRLKAAEYEANRVDKAHYGLLNRLNGIKLFPGIWIHGTGRAFGFSRQYGGDSPLPIASPGLRDTAGYLDLLPEGVVGKQVAWSALIRINSPLQPNAGLDSLSFRKITLQFNPDWASFTLGDFTECFTPLVLFNRNSLDLKYRPEMFARLDETRKYDQFLNEEPALPFRGIRAATAVKWPGAGIAQEAGASLFAHMIRNGFNDTTANSDYFGPYEFTDWIFGGNARLKLQKWYLGRTSLQLALNAYGIILNQFSDSDTPGSPYQAYDPSTWARRYWIGSLKPSLSLGTGGDLTIGAEMETAAQLYEDDQQDAAKNIRDYALLGGPFVQLGNSRISFNYLWVGPYYYSPLAQLRQDSWPLVSANPFVPGTGGLLAPDLCYPPLRSSYLLPSVPRPGAVYGYYDRTQDNTFPYGLATPNRRGGGVEWDVRALKDDSLKFAGSVYRVQEMSENNAVNIAGSAFQPVDAPPGFAAPVRDFTYLNLGPSFNLGPYIGWGRDVEVGANVRVEQTKSSLGTLDCGWVLGSVRVEALAGWDVAVAFSRQTMSGSEAGLNGTLLARYAFLFDATDQGQYGLVNVNGSVESLRFSSRLQLDRHSRLFLDVDFTNGNILPFAPSTAGNLSNQYMELTYEVKF